MRTCNSKLQQLHFQCYGGVSNAGEESSEEEEEDESASPSLRGATSSITAAKHQTSRKKLTIFSERGYLNSLSRAALELVDHRDMLH